MTIGGIKEFLRVSADSHVHLACGQNWGTFIKIQNLEQLHLILEQKDTLQKKLPKKWSQPSIPRTRKRTHLNCSTVEERLDKPFVPRSEPFVQGDHPLIKRLPQGLVCNFGDVLWLSVEEPVGLAVAGGEGEQVDGTNTTIGDVSHP